MSQTIFALATAPGRSAVAIVRLSGARCSVVSKQMTGRCLTPRRAELATLRTPRGGDPLDQALCLFFPGPQSFTGEDLLEFHLHGSSAVVAAVLACLGSVEGLRPAEPGEFTRRAFENGKLDLAEVEGLADLIAARTSAQHQQALRQMGGGLSRLVAGWKDRLVTALAWLEAEIDFPDDDLEDGLSRRVCDLVAGLLDDIGAHLEDGQRGERLRDGLHLAVVGPPNAGKSSLLNLLARRDVAIVSDIAGTTRDVIEVHLDLAGVPVTLADTAGLRDRQGGDGIEDQGIARARACAQAADLILVVFDCSSWMPDQGLLDPYLDPEIRAVVGEKTVLTLLNKLDVSSCPGAVQGAAAKKKDIFPLSVATGVGIDVFLDQLNSRVMEKAGLCGSALLTRERHRVALQDVKHSLTRALSMTSHPELAAEDLRLAVRSLGRITGRVDVDDVLDVIFRDFCLGK